MEYSAYFTNSEVLGLDDYDMSTYVAIPAFQVLGFVKKPTGDPEACMVTRWKLADYEETMEFLKKMGIAMVQIYPAGVSVGEYHIRPYFISPKQYATLLQARMA